MQIMYDIIYEFFVRKYHVARINYSVIKYQW